jgi:hypothetical protein
MRVSMGRRAAGAMKHPWQDAAKIISRAGKIRATLRRGLQLSAACRVFGGMKTFLKIFLLVCLALVALKLLPLTLALGCVMAIVLAGLVVLGLGFAVVLSPLWVPALVITGIVSLIVRTGRRAAT